jgi:hypothetical protein
MDTSELKLRIFREIDSLEQGKLQEVYGYLQNFLRSDKDIDDWDILTVSQKEGLQNAINDLDAGEGIVHEDVVSKYRKKYPND